MSNIKLKDGCDEHALLLRMVNKKTQEDFDKIYTVTLRFKSKVDDAEFLDHTGIKDGIHN